MAQGILFIQAADVTRFEKEFMMARHEERDCIMGQQMLHISKSKSRTLDTYDSQQTCLESTRDFL